MYVLLKENITSGEFQPQNTRKKVVLSIENDEKTRDGLVSNLFRFGIGTSSSKIGSRF